MAKFKDEIADIKKDFGTERDRAKLKELKAQDKMLKNKSKKLEKDLKKYFKKNPKKVSMAWYQEEGLLGPLFLPSYSDIKKLEGYKVLHEKCKAIDINILYDDYELVFDIDHLYSTSPDASLFDPALKKQDVQAEKPAVSQEDDFSVKTRRAIPIKKHLDL